MAGDREGKRSWTMKLSGEEEERCSCYDRTNTGDDCMGGSYCAATGRKLVDGEEGEE